MRRSAYRRDLVLQRTAILYSMAVDSVRRGEWEYAIRLVNHALNLLEANNIRMPRRIKRGICKRCHIPLIPGLTARYRLRREGKRSWIVVTCLRCGYMKRYPYKVGGRAGSKE